MKRTKNKEDKVTVILIGLLAIFLGVVFFLTDAHENEIKTMQEEFDIKINQTFIDGQIDGYNKALINILVVSLECKPVKINAYDKTYEYIETRCLINGTK